MKTFKQLICLSEEIIFTLQLRHVTKGTAFCMIDANKTVNFRLENSLDTLKKVKIG